MLQLLRILLVTSLTALGAFVILPLPFVAVGNPALPGAAEAASWRSLSVGLFYPSAQLLGVWLAGSWLGARAGASAMLLYLALGAFGLPVFIDGGGLDYSRHSALLPLMGFPVGAVLIARLRAEGSGRRTFGAVLAATLMVSLCAVISGVAGSGLWLDWRQWAAFGLPHLQSLIGWVAVIAVWSVASSFVYRVRLAWAPPAPPAEPEAEPDVPEEAPRGSGQLALPSGRPRDQRALPPSLTENAKQLPAPPRSLPPGR